MTTSSLTARSRKPQVASALGRYSSSFLWALAILGLLLLLMVLPRSPLPWYDEVLMQSTALSIARGKAAVPSVLGAFPTVRSFGLFFGPVGIALGVADVKLFGVSVVGWRMLGWFGALGVILVSAWVTRRLTSSPIAAAAAAALAAFSQGVGARATSGRLDTITVTLELASLGCAIASLQSANARTARLFAVLCGLFCGLAILSTPRSFPFALGLVLALGVEVLANINQARRLALDAIVAGAVVVGLIVIWSLLEKTSPVGWLRFILASSHGDAINVSPLLGGQWHLLDGPLIERVVGFSFLLVVVALLGFAGHLTANQLNTANVSANDLRFALVVGLVNYYATLVLISRFWDYDVFVVPVLLPGLIATSFYLISVEGTRSKRAMLILTVWIFWIAGCFCLRGGKVLAWANSYPQRDMAAVTRFVAEHVPRNSAVLGPTDAYFYAVENAGSRYLYARPWVSTGLAGTGVDTPPDWDALFAGGNVYLIWPRGSSIPLRLEHNHLQMIGQFKPVDKPGRLAWVGVAGEGYPLTDLYQVVRP